MTTITDRNKKILTRVRAKLGKLGTNEIQNDDIYDNSNIVQDDMLQDMKCVEKIFKIYLKANKTDYPVEHYNSLLITKIIPSWDDASLDYLKEWEDAKDVTGSDPIYYQLFGGKFIIAPAPSDNSYYITFWAYQTSVINGMDDIFEPETPESIDNVLILGICAEFNPEFKPLYELEKERKKTLFHVKTTKKQSSIPTW